MESEAIRRCLASHDPLGGGDASQAVATDLHQAATVIRANGLQRMMLFWERFSPVNAAHVFTLGTGCTFTYSDLENRVADLFAAMRVGSFVACDRSAEIVHSADEAAVEVRRHVSSAPLETACAEVLESEFSRRFPAASCPIRLVWVEEAVPGRGRSIVVVYRHAILDSASVRVVFQQLLSACQHGTSVQPLSIYPGTLWADAQTRGLVRIVDGVTTFFAEWWRMFGCQRFRDGNAARESGRVLNHPESVPVERVIQTAQRYGVTVQDLLFAALGEGLVKVDPEICGRRGRGRLVLQCPVNLRGILDVRDAAIGQLLGSVQVQEPFREAGDFGELVRRIHAQTHQQKGQYSAVAQPRSLSILHGLTRWLPRRWRLWLHQDSLPVAASISNVDARDQFQGEYARQEIVGYRRATLMGAILPLMLTVTTFGDSINFVSCRRSGFLDDERSERLVRHIAGRLTGQ
ncbi:MAG: hypothetical protein R3B90_12265 [Planctomycetaceae bacterium]